MQHNVIRQSDRRKAIATAAALSRQGSIIALLGKGHENYYIANGNVSHFDDFEEICSF
jgi:UDP-N-acetylmuramoyl-L-alanyl-D-glutamate--2,6-diaminopimelate ligase